MTTNAIKVLREAESKATKGPWRWEGVSILAPSGNQVLWPFNIPRVIEEDDPAAVKMGACGIDTEADAEANHRLLIVARNTLPALLDLCEAQAARIAALEARLESGTWHNGLAGLDRETKAATDAALARLEQSVGGAK